MLKEFDISSLNPKEKYTLILGSDWTDDAFKLLDAMVKKSNLKITIVKVPANDYALIGEHNAR